MKFIGTSKVCKAIGAVVGIAMLGGIYYLLFRIKALSILIHPIPLALFFWSFSKYYQVFIEVKSQHQKIKDIKDKLSKSEGKLSRIEDKQLTIFIDDISFIPFFSCIAKFSNQLLSIACMVLLAQPFRFTFFRFIMAASTRKILIFRAINRRMSFIF